MMPGDGARVALVGTDAASSGGILAVCNSQGQATFNAVTGPFTVTAQLDVTRPSFSPGLPPRLTRTGVTLVNLPAPSGTIGMPIFGFDFQPVTVDATIDGTVMNLPTLGAGEELVVDVSISSGGLFFNQTQVNPMDGSYSLAIPSGIPVNATLIHRDGFCTTLSILSVRGVGPAAPGGSITQNFDAASSAVVPFDHAVNMTYNNALPTGPNTSSSGGLCLDENGSEIACFCLFDAGSGPLPATVMIPDPADPNLAGLQLSLDVNQNVFQIVLGQGPEVNCELVLTGSPTALTFDFPGVPTVNAPTQGATLMVSEAATMAVDFTEGTGGLASGLNFVDIESGSGMTLNGVLAGRIAGLGVDEVEWCIFLPVGTSSLTLPRTAQDVFAPGAYTLKAEQFRSDQTIIYNSFFNENVEQNLNNLIDSLQSDCDADSEEIVFTVVADMPAP